MVGKIHLNGQMQGFDYWDVLPGQGSYFNPDFISGAGRKKHEGYVTDIITEKSVDWLVNKRDRNKPFMLMCQHKAPHRNWMPALRHLELYQDCAMPEPATLFDRWHEAWLASLGADLPEPYGPQPVSPGPLPEAWATEASALLR